MCQLQQTQRCKSSNTVTCRQRRAQGFVSGVAGITPVAPEFMPWHISRPFTWTFVYGSRDSDTRPLFHPPTSSFSFSSSSFTLSSFSSLLQSLFRFEEPRVGED